MTDNNFAAQVAYYELDRTPKSAFAGVKRALNRRIDKALDRFYEKVSSVPQLGHFFSGKEHMNRAKQAQTDHWIGVFTNGVDDAYHKRAINIGQVHARIGLEPKWYVGGYTIVLEEIIEELVAPGLWKLLPWRRALAKQLTALVRVSLLDIDLGLSGYFIDTEEKMRTVVRDKLGNALASVAKGNLTVHAAGLPEEYAKVENDFNDAVSALRDAMTAVVDGVAAISDGSREINAASDDLARRTEQQAASLEETAASISEVTTKVQETASTTAEARKSIVTAHEQASQGSVVVSQAVEAMGQIEESSKQISQIITVIDGIAFQTNLLALNAGVEAARAGEAGKGFAVVASEVRALAQRSAEAANDIKELITGSAQQVAKGVELVGETGSALASIADRVGTLRDAIDGIAQSAELQAANLGQINSAVGDMDRMTQQNAAMAEQCTAAARSLAEQAGEVAGAVETFNLDDGAGSRPAVSDPQALAA
ncbi:MAG: globin-coupled sensor protein [Novosphingobium sp.]|nr:globin-coupled sensor protein [Novosphingobium sp.]MCP5402193.1 globin-coupled sensor protein [Novosphingobium sp.]